MSRLNRRRHACFSRGCVFGYDDLTRDCNHNPHNARCWRIVDPPPCLDQHTGGSRLTPTVHRCPKGMAVGGSSPQHKAQQYSAETRQTWLRSAGNKSVVLWRTQKRVCCSVACSSNEDEMRLRMRRNQLMWKSSCLNALVGERDDKSVTHRQRQGTLPRYDHHLSSDVGKRDDKSVMHRQRQGTLPRCDHHVYSDSGCWTSCREIVTQSSYDGAEHE